jgi:hypothetical protein
MTTNRTPINRKAKLGRVTPEVLAAYRHARKLYDTSPVDKWGQRSPECNAARLYLHELLGRNACDMDILETIGEEGPTPEHYWPTQFEFWEGAAAIRRELERLCRG